MLNSYSMATLVNLHQYTHWKCLDLVLGKNQIGSKDEKFLWKQPEKNEAKYWTM